MEWSEWSPPSEASAACACTLCALAGGASRTSTGATAARASSAYKLDSARIGFLDPTTVVLIHRKCNGHWMPRPHQALRAMVNPLAAEPLRIGRLLPPSPDSDCERHAWE